MKVKANVAPIGTPDFAGWGLTPDASPILRIVATGVEVLIELSPETARDICVDGCFAFATAKQIRQGNGLPKGVESSLVDAQGMPLIGGGR